VTFSNSIFLFSLPQSYMFGKILASIVLIIVLYILGVFLAPNFMDSIAERLGMMSVNTIIRNLKSGADSTSDTLLQIKDASGAIGTARSIATQANDTLQKTTETINTIRQVGEQKVQQVQKTAESVQKAGQAISEVQDNISELTTLSWMTSTGVSQTGTIQ